MKKKQTIIHSTKDYRKAQRSWYFSIAVFISSLVILTIINYLLIKEFQFKSSNQVLITSVFELLFIFISVFILLKKTKSVIFVILLVATMETLMLYNLVDICLKNNVALIPLIMLIIVGCLKIILWIVALIKVARADSFKVEALKQHTEIDIPFNDNHEYDLKAIVEPPRSKHKLVKLRRFQTVKLAIITYGSLFIYVLIQFGCKSFKEIAGTDFAVQTILVSVLTSMFLWILPIVCLSMHNKYQTHAIYFALGAELIFALFRYTNVYRMFNSQTYHIGALVLIICFDLFRYLIYTRIVKSFLDREKHLVKSND